MGVCLGRRSPGQTARVSQKLSWVIGVSGYLLRPMQGGETR